MARRNETLMNTPRTQQGRWEAAALACLRRAVEALHEDAGKIFVADALQFMPQVVEAENA